VVEQNWFWESGSLINMSSILSHVPVVLEWMILETSFNTLPIANKTAGKINPNIDTVDYLCSSSFHISASNQTSFACSCKSGFEGNPYLVGGCGGKLSFSI
jgi:hypothetical protein